MAGDNALRREGNDLKNILSSKTKRKWGVGFPIIAGDIGKLF